MTTMKIALEDLLAAQLDKRVARDKARAEFQEGKHRLTFRIAAARLDEDNNPKIRLSKSGNSYVVRGINLDPKTNKADGEWTDVSIPKKSVEQLTPEHQREFATVLLFGGNITSWFTLHESPAKDQEGNLIEGETYCNYVATGLRVDSFQKPMGNSDSPNMEPAPEPAMTPEEEVAEDLAHEMDRSELISGLPQE